MSTAFGPIASTGTSSTVGLTSARRDAPARHRRRGRAVTTWTSSSRRASPSERWHHAWKDAAAEPADLVYFAGDYIYEYATDATSVRWPYTPPLPSDFARETDTLGLFRQQYGLYKTDPDLQEAHRVSPWMITWDDHEVYNDYDAEDPALYQLRANAYRAFWEHMPLRPPQRPSGYTARMYRQLNYGDLVRFHVIDTRQYKTGQLPGSTVGDTAERRDPSRQILGPAQEAWLLDNLGSGHTTWDAMANTVLFSRLDSDDTAGERFSTGQWDAYQAAQQRVIDTVAAKDAGGFVVLTGDIHRNYHLNVLSDFEDPDSRVVGVEFAGTSISSGRDGGETDAGLEVRKRANPHLVSADLRRGHLRCRITHDLWTTQVRAVDRISSLDYRAWTSHTLVTALDAPASRSPEPPGRAREPRGDRCGQLAARVKSRMRRPSGSMMSV